MIKWRLDDIPVFLDANDLHSTWVNTAALRAAGIDRDTVDPIGGQIVRDENGDATGFLLETAAMDLLADYLDGIRTEEEVDGHLELAFSAYLAAGVTGAADMGMTEQSIAALRVDGQRRYEVITEECVGCNLCQHVCPVPDCISMVSVDTGKPYLNWTQDPRNPHAKKAAE